MTFFTHWRDVPKAAWRWANFSPAEIACRGTGKLLVNEAALDKLQALRLRLGNGLAVNGHMCGIANRKDVRHTRHGQVRRYDDAAGPVGQHVEPARRL